MLFKLTFFSSAILFLPFINLELFRTKQKYIKMSRESKLSKDYFHMLLFGERQSARKPQVFQLGSE